MTGDREQLDKLMELMGEGPTRRIRLTVLAFLARLWDHSPGVGVVAQSSGDQ